MNRHLHIVCPKLPWPPDNGFSIDIFYKIKALHRLGVKTQLHYLSGNTDKPPTGLLQLCESIHPYTCNKKKEKTILDEKNKRILVESLSRDNHPVLLAGINDQVLIESLSANHKIVVRLYKKFCSIDDIYNSTNNFLLYKIRLFKLPKKNKNADDIFATNCMYAFSTPEESDAVFNQQYNNASYLPLTLPFEDVTATPGRGNFCLYHGDLSDPKNEKAVVWLLKKVFNNIKIPLIIAGKNPGNRIKKWAAFYSHVCLVADPSCSEMEDLIHKAHINVLPSFDTKKPESKLLHTLFMGRHCVTNQNAVAGTTLEAACHVNDTSNSFKSIILRLSQQPFEQVEIDLRKKLLKKYLNGEPVKMLVNWLFP